ncbi:MAG: hypothetical protein J6B94_08460 [Lachnospiraceae bacterium]|nr:hypothetical protein [Lachnospiraceae bacterium]
MKTLLEKLENLIAEYKEKLQESENTKVQLSELKPGDVFETSFGDLIVLEHIGDKTKVITKGFTKENQRFDEDSPNFATSEISEYLSKEVLEMFEKEFGSENVVEHIEDVFSVDMQKYDSYMGKIRLLTFEEARKYNDLIVNKELPRWWWTMTPWSTKERGWEYSITVVSPSGIINGIECDNYCGVRPVCILKSNIFVSKKND